MFTPTRASLFAALLAVTFAAVALLLAAIGLYAVIAEYVRQRAPDFGVRVALGATRRDIRRLVVAEAVWLVGSGVIVGFAIAAAAFQMLRGMLFEVAPIDPVVSILSVTTVILVTAVASCVPLTRAAAADPLTVIRSS